ncbi:MAG: HEAT repeat domain-containing protein [Proteobacteria bacterium]|nr:HEAT repeat domain-containing protein [Pseudomonadota bacterium]
MFGHLLRAFACVVVVLGMIGRFAHADTISDLLPNLENNAKNVRLAAAVALSKQNDPRVILPFVKVLGNDSDAQVRAVAANGLGRVVTSTTKEMLKKLAVNALTAAAKTDSDDAVRSQAAAALTTITGAKVAPTVQGVAGASAGGGGGGVYVNVGPMSSKTGGTDDAKLRDMMVKTTTKTLSKSDPNMQQTWPGGLPTKQALDKKGVAGFYVDGTLNELTAKPAGSNVTITCKVSMLLASYPDKAIFGMLNGGASVQATSSESEKALARQDCVEAVIASLIATKIIPTIKSKVANP